MWNYKQIFFHQSTDNRNFLFPLAHQGPAKVSLPFSKRKKQSEGKTIHFPVEAGNRIWYNEWEGCLFTGYT